MERKANKYHLTLELISTAKGETGIHDPLQLDFDNHDEIFSIIKRIQEKNLFQSKEQAAEFAIGLKLFSEVMLKNRSLLLFEEFRPAFGKFMKNLKEIPATE
jgi:hypothetical protein